MWIVSERKSIIIDSADVAQFRVLELRAAGDAEPTGWQVVAVMRPDTGALNPAEPIPLAVFDSPETADDEMRELCDLLNGHARRPDWP